jgi:hypothetical protein
MKTLPTFTANPNAPKAGQPSTTGYEATVGARADLAHDGHTTYGDCYIDAMDCDDRFASYG